MKVYIIIRETHRTDGYIESSVWRVSKDMSEAKSLAKFWNEHTEYSTFYVEEWEVSQQMKKKGKVINLGTFKPTDTRNELHFAVQKSTRAQVFRDRTKYNRKRKHKNKWDQRENFLDKTQKMLYNISIEGGKRYL